MADHSSATRCITCKEVCGTSQDNPVINGHCRSCWRRDQAPKLKKWLEGQGFDFPNSGDRLDG